MDPVVDFFSDFSMDEATILTLTIVAIISTSRVAYKFLDLLSDGIKKLINTLEDMMTTINTVNKSITDGNEIDEEQTNTLLAFDKSIKSTIIVQKETQGEILEINSSVNDLRDFLITSISQISTHFEEVQTAMKTHDANAQSRNKTVISVLNEAKQNLIKLELQITDFLKQSEDMKSDDTKT